MRPAVGCFTVVERRSKIVSIKASMIASWIVDACKKFAIANSLIKHPN